MSACNSHLTSTYIAPLDADIETAHAALLAIDPVSSLATRLSALGLDDRAVWAESSEATTDTDGARELGFGLLWTAGRSSRRSRASTRKPCAAPWTSTLPTLAMPSGPRG